MANPIFANNFNKNDANALVQSKTVQITGRGGQKFPAVEAIRACPKCFKINRHNGSGCRLIACGRCHHKFCIYCLGADPNSGENKLKGQTTNVPPSTCIHDDLPCRRPQAKVQTPENAYGA